MKNAKKKKKKKEKKKEKDVDDMVYEGKTYKRVLILYILGFWFLSFGIGMKPYPKLIGGKNISSLNFSTTSTTFQMISIGF